MVEQVRDLAVVSSDVGCPTSQMLDQVTCVMVPVVYYLNGHWTEVFWKADGIVGVTIYYCYEWCVARIT